MHSPSCPMPPTPPGSAPLSPHSLSDEDDVSSSQSEGSLSPPSPDPPTSPTSPASPGISPSLPPPADPGGGGTPIGSSPPGKLPTSPPEPSDPPELPEGSLEPPPPPPPGVGNSMPPPPPDEPPPLEPPPLEPPPLEPPPLEPPPLEPPPLEPPPLEPPEGGEPPLGLDEPPLGLLEPPLELLVSLQALAKSTVNAIKMTGLIQLEIDVVDRRDVIVVTLCMAQTVRGLEHQKRRGVPLESSPGLTLSAALYLSRRYNAARIRSTPVAELRQAPAPHAPEMPKALILLSLAGSSYRPREGSCGTVSGTGRRVCSAVPVQRRPFDVVPVTQPGRPHP